MTSEKNEAQLRNEAEVRRVLEERGYNSASSKKKVKKYFNRGFSVGPFIYGSILIGIVILGFFFFKDKLFGVKPNSDLNDDSMVVEVDSNLTAFRECLDSIDFSEIAIDDIDFWNKHISRHEQAISCYDSYPSVSDLAEKNKLQDELAELKANSEKAEANDINYRMSMAQIDAELAENLARIREESAKWDQELSRSTQERQARSEELEAEYARQQQLREQQTAAAEAERQRQEQVAKAKCDEYKAMYGEKTANEIAESDSEVVRAKYAWTQAQKKIRSCNYGTQPQRDLCNSYRDGEVQAAESYHATYVNILQQKVTYYINLKLNSCGY